jgi:PadR family transcriptional regulator PadR
VYQLKNEMIKGYIDGIVLSILSQRDAYGYEISQHINQVTDGAFLLKEGTLYPALKRLEANTYIEGYWGEQEGGPRRKYYRITDEGQLRLEAIKTSWEQNTHIINIFLGGTANGHSILFRPSF